MRTCANTPNFTPPLSLFLPRPLPVSLSLLTLVGLVSFLALFLNKDEEEGLPEEEAPPYDVRPA